MNNGTLAGKIAVVTPRGLALIWGIPVMNYDLMFQSFVRDGKGGENQILYWSGLSDWKG